MARFLSVLCVLGLLATTNSSLAGGAADDVAAARPPNILLLVAEDLSPRLGSYGDAVARTPNLDALARRSVRYTNVFTAAGVCAPSRAALIMGQHQISFAGQHMRTSTGPLGEYYALPPADAKAFPEWLRRAGYYTYTDSKLDYQFSGIRAGSGPFSIWDAEGAGTHWRNRPPGQPFFGMINFLETHESGVMRAEGEPWSAAHAQTQQFRRRASMVPERVTSPEAVQLPPYYPDVPAVRADLARHYDNIRAMDQRVGRILAELAEDGLADSTIVIWTTDHGDGLPRAKRELFDSGLQVPMLVYLPEGQAYLPAGQAQSGQWQPGGVDDRLVSFVDLAPTILSLAGVAPPGHMKGRNFFESRRRYVYASRDRIDEVMDRQRAVRDSRWKYIRSWYPQVPGGHELAYRDNLDMVREMRALYRSGELTPAQAAWFEAPGAEQLFDLSNDPFELHNLAGTARVADVQRRLAGELDRWLEQTGDTGEIPEVELRLSLLDAGAVPQTASPQVRVHQGQVTASADQGASIGYRVGNGAWQLYVQPLPAAAGQLSPAAAGAVEFKAVRYGWRESEVVRLVR